MPKGISITNYQIDCLSDHFEQKFRYAALTTKNLPVISEIIASATGQLISTSTLKRIFSKHGKFLPTRSTLDVLAKSVGFSSWNDFLIHDARNADFEYYEYIAYILKESYSDFAEFKQIFERFQDTEHSFKIAIVLIEEAIRKKDLVTLKKMVEIPKIWDKGIKNEKVFLFYEQVCMKLRDSEVIDDLIEFFAMHPVAQTYYIERCTDEEKLDGYYGRMIESYLKYKKNDEAQLFGHCLLCQRDFEMGNFNSQHYRYLLNFKSNNLISPIPLIKRYALLIARHSEDQHLIDLAMDDINEMLAGHDENTVYYSVYKFCSIVFISRNAYPIERMFETTRINISNQSNFHLINRTKNMLKVYLAFVQVSKGRKAEAIKTLNSYNKYFCHPHYRVKINSHIDYVKKMLDSI